ncbi:hypothetical protein DFH09DRAFT_319440 [Mycena vulgaris]|nr:hypothetical protein DFH09DRAFT_319440 [Mycena vulgaris]
MYNRTAKTSDSTVFSGEPLVTPYPVSSSRSPYGASYSAGERYHPYEQGNEKRRHKDKTPRRIWNHALEKPLFNQLELTILGQTQRRPIYIASLEAHIDRLHAQLSGLGPQFYPVAEKELESLKGLNMKTCKGMVAGLQNDISHARERLLELQRSNEELEAAVRATNSV